MEDEWPSFRLRARNPRLDRRWRPLPALAGKQLGAADERDLFAWAVGLAERVRPKALLLENVRGLSANRFAAYRQNVLDTLQDVGYVAQWEPPRSRGRVRDAGRSPLEGDPRGARPAPACAAPRRLMRDDIDGAILEARRMLERIRITAPGGGPMARTGCSARRLNAGPGFVSPLRTMRGVAVHRPQ
ncbi:DNA cytosine methyltransferase [Streptomyces sp. NPDC102409]|uniref:DNA cytosine methyltransferase n=1 Tax=Streptomyces sp. NPDC102409 TaxID=3366172 RepID=UPI003803E415